MIPSQVILGASHNAMPPSVVGRKSAVDSSQDTACLLSPRDRYFSLALQQGIIDVNGRFQFPCRERIALDADDQKEILNFWNNNSFGTGFSWNFHTFLKYFVHYFSKTFKGTTIVETQGTFWTVGKKFWKKTLKKIIDPAILREFKETELWNFCTERPLCYELWVCLEMECTELELHQFKELVIYFLVVQSLPDPPKNHIEAMRNLISDDNREELQKLHESLRPHVKMWHGVNETTKKRFATVEICTQEISLRVIFTFTPAETNCFLLDDFQLEIRPDEEAILAPSLVAPSTTHLEYLHDNLIHKLHLNTPLNTGPSIRRALGRYWAHLTNGGPVFESDQLESLLIGALIRSSENASLIISDGFSVGMQFLPRGSEALLAYHYNSVYFLNRHLSPMPTDLKNITATTAFGKFLLTHDFFLLTSVLQVVGFFQADLEKHPSDAPKCRRVMGMPWLEISWKQESTLHIVMPFDFDKALEHLIFCMKQNEQACLECISEALEVFLPAFPAITNKKPFSTEDARLCQIYWALCNNKQFGKASVRLLFLMHVAGLHSLETSDVIRLPDQIAAEVDAVESQMAGLKRIYKETRFAPLFKAVKTKILSLEERTPTVCRQAAMELLLVYDDPQTAALAWASSSEIRLSFLMESASTMPESSLACALHHVCKYGRTMNLDEKIHLFAVYLERLKKQSPPYTFSLTYEPMLIELLEEHLQSDHLKAHPRAIEAIAQSHSVKTSHLLENLRQSLPTATSAPSRWWEELLGVQGRLHERQHIEEFDAIFLESLIQVHLQKGFTDIFNSVAGRVYERRVEKGLLLITTFIRSLSFQQADRSFLVNLLCFLTSRPEATTSDRLADVHLLCASVKPTSKEIPRLTDYFLGYYSTLLNQEGAGILIDDVRKSLVYFSSLNDTRIAPIIHQLVAVLMRDPKNRTLWSNFPMLLNEMEKTHLFLEDSIVVLETLASQNALKINHPPFECFKLKFTKIGKRLNEDQKNRLAKAYGVIFTKAAARQRENDFSNSIPSIAWVQERLKNQGLWQEFAGLYLPLARRQAANMEDVEWIASRLLAESASPLFAPLAEVLSTVPVSSLNTPAWKRHLAGLITRGTACASLFKPLLENASKTELPFFRACQQLHLEGAIEKTAGYLTDYQRTGAMADIAPAAASKPVSAPDPQDAERQIRAQFKKAIKGKSVPLKNFQLALSLLEKLPSPEWELWMQLFACRPEHTNELLDKAWSLWIEKHPIKDYQSKDTVYWVKAIKSLFTNLDPHSPVFINFLTHQALDHVVKLDSEACKVMTGATLEMGTISCWDDRNTNSDTLPRVQAMHAITASLIVYMRMLDYPINCLNEPCQILLYLLFAHFPQEVMYTTGETWLLRRISYIASRDSYNSDINTHLFHAYCMNPYIPSTLQSQRTFLHWIAKSWPVLISKITWVEACCLFRAMSQFDFEKIYPENPFVYFHYTCNIWDQLVIGLPTRMNQEDIIPTSNMFSELTRMLMEKIVKYNKDRENVLYLLNIMRGRFQNDVKKFVTVETWTLFQLQYCSHVFSIAFSNTPAETVKVALVCLNANHAYLKDNSNTHCKSAIKAFSASLPILINVADPVLIRESVDNIMNIPWVKDAETQEGHSLETLLYSLCASVQRSLPERRSITVQTASQVFMSCTHPELIQDESLIMRSIAILAFFFLPLSELDCLSIKERNNLIQGLSDTSVKMMISYLMSDEVNQDFHKTISNNMATARLIRHANPCDPSLLSTLQECCVRGAGSRLLPFNVAFDESYQLRLRSQWISTICALAERCSEMGQSINPELTLRKIQLTTELVELVLPKISDDESYKKFSRILVEVLSCNDLEVTQTMVATLSSHPSHLLTSFKDILTKKVAALQKKL